MGADQSKIAKWSQEIEDARKVLAAANQTFDSKYKRLKKRIEAEQAKDEMTLERALVTYGEAGLENTAGWQFLHDLTWKGAWTGTGLMGAGGYWIETNQYIIKVAIPRTFETAQLERLRDLILEVEPAIKPGAFEEYPEAKVLDVLDDGLNECRSWKLMLVDGTWHVVDARSYEFRYNKKLNSMFKGDLLGALTAIRNNCSYN